MVNIEEFITIKGWKALGNKLTNKKIKEIKLLDSLPYMEVKEEITEEIREIIETEEVGEVEIIMEEEPKVKKEDTPIAKKEEEKEDKKKESDKDNLNISDEGPHQITLDL